MKKKIEKIHLAGLPPMAAYEYWRLFESKINEIIDAVNGEDEEFDYDEVKKALDNAAGNSEPMLGKIPDNQDDDSNLCACGGKSKLPEIDVCEDCL